MEYGKINNLLFSEDSESEQLSKFVNLSKFVYLILIVKINQFDLKQLC